MSMSSMHSYAWRAMPRRDDPKGGVKVPKGTWKRVFRFAAPYRASLTVFLVLIVADA
jgi:hypothetical protein